MGMSGGVSTSSVRPPLSDHCWSAYIIIYICIYMFVDKKLLNRTLVIDSPFQRFAVDFLSNLSSPEMLSSLNKSRISLCNADFALLYEG